LGSASNRGRDATSLFAGRPGFSRKRGTARGLGPIVRSGGDRAGGVNLRDRSCPPASSGKLNSTGAAKAVRTTGLLAAPWSLTGASATTSDPLVWFATTGDFGVGTSTAIWSFLSAGLPGVDDESSPPPPRVAK